MPRKERNSKIPKENLLVPFDVSKFGSEEDPCFGKAYDLSAPECQRCGDLEFCAIAFSQKQHLLRAVAAGQQAAIAFQKRELDTNKTIKAFIRKKQAAGLTKTKIILLASKKFDLPKPNIRKFFT